MNGLMEYFSKQGFHYMREMFCRPEIWLKMWYIDREKILEKPGAQKKMGQKRKVFGTNLKIVAETETVAEDNVEIETEWNLKYYNPTDLSVAIQLKQKQSGI